MAIVDISEVYGENRGRTGVKINKAITVFIDDAIITIENDDNFVTFHSMLSEDICAALDYLQGKQ